MMFVHELMTIVQYSRKRQQCDVYKLPINEITEYKLFQVPANERTAFGRRKNNLLRNDWKSRHAGGL